MGQRCQPDRTQMAHRLSGTVFILEGSNPRLEHSPAPTPCLKKRVWMQRGANTTYVQYRLTRKPAGPDAVTAQKHLSTISGITTARLSSIEWQPEIIPVEAWTAPTVYALTPLETPFDVLHLLSSTALPSLPQFDWYHEGFLSEPVEANTAARTMLKKMRYSKCRHN